MFLNRNLNILNYWVGIFNCVWNHHDLRKHCTTRTFNLKVSYKKHNKIMLTCVEYKNIFFPVARTIRSYHHFDEQRLNLANHESWFDMIKAGGDPLLWDELILFQFHSWSRGLFYLLHSLFPVAVNFSGASVKVSEECNRNKRGCHDVWHLPTPRKVTGHKMWQVEVPFTVPYIQTFRLQS